MTTFPVTTTSNGITRLALSVLMVVVFLGYMMIWVLKPTNLFFLHWEPEILAKTMSTYFGDEGTNTLIFSFPILLIATSACLYLHLKKKAGHDSDTNTESLISLNSFRQPVLVKGPLGVVAWTELFFSAMFICLLIWSFSSYLHNIFAHIAEQAAGMGIPVWEAKLEMSGLVLGLVGNVCLAFLFFPVTRGSSILQFLNLTSESSIKYHIWLGQTVMIVFTSHGLCYVIFWAKTNQIHQMFKWDKHGISNLAGEISLLVGLVMWATSIARIRRRIFELFYYTHHLYTVFVVFFVFHTGFSNACVVLPGFYLFLIDRFLRFLQSQQRVRLVSARLIPGEAMELNFSKSTGLSYCPTSTVFINVPCISKLQWHPFSITSSSNLDPEHMSIIVKTEGRWTQQLYKMLSSPTPIDHLQVSLEGPYGPASTNFNRHDMLVMICGGSGITPFISIIRDLLFKANTMNDATPRILLVCAFKKSVELTMLDLLLPASEATFDISLIDMQIEAYITRETDHLEGNQDTVIRNLWFKHDTLDSPVSAILGQNSSLCLGVIISSSFIVFLLLIGILTRYYIYPIDHNTNNFFSQPLRSTLSMLFICISIAMTATAAFLWNKKPKAQINNLSIPTHITTSPGQRTYNADRELVCISHKSLFQATNVYYGERPNLTRILLECKGENVGVLVSGPRKMRQEVAAICTFGLTHNLHFESISFSW